MKKSGVIKLEIRRALNPIVLAGFAFFLILCLIISWIGISTYKSEERRVSEFQKSEIQMSKRFVSWQQYGTIGYRIIFLPPPISALFFNSTTFSSIVGRIDTGFQLDFSKPESPDNIFMRPTGGFVDITTLINIIGSLLILPFGFMAFRNKEYLYFLKSFCPHKQVYFNIIISRAIIIFWALIIIGLLITILFPLNGLNLSFNEIVLFIIFLFVSWISLTFIMTVSSIIGLIKIQQIGIPCAIGCWFFLSFLSPEIFNEIFFKSVKMESRYAHELAKLEILMDFEKQALKASNKYISKEDKIKSDQFMAKHYLKLDYPKIVFLEKRNLIKLRENTRSFFLFSSFSPFTFSRCVANEISGKGFNGYITFYNKNIDEQRRFLEYYIDNFNKNNYGKVIPFTEKNVYKSIGSLPANFLLGMTINVFSLILVLIAGCYAFFQKKSSIPNIQDIKDLQPEKIYYYFTKDKEVIDDLIYRLNSENHVFIPSPEKLFLSCELLKKLLNIRDGSEKWEIILSYAIESKKNIVGIDFMGTLSDENINKLKSLIIRNKRQFVNFGSDRYQAMQCEILFHQGDKTVDVSRLNKVFKNRDSRYSNLLIEN